jgi:hypothetical protein
MNKICETEFSALQKSDYVSFLCFNPLAPGDPYLGRTIYGSYRTANLQALNFKYLFSKHPC